VVIVTSMATPPDEAVWAIATVAIMGRSLHLVAELGLAEVIDRHPVSVEELASRCDIDPGSLDRVLRLLAANGIFVRHGRTYAHNESSRLLRSDHPMSLRTVAGADGLASFWRTCGDSELSPRGTPTTGARDVPSRLRARLGSHAHQPGRFPAAVSAAFPGDVDAVVNTYRFEPFRTIAHIGGARSGLLMAILDAVPSARGVLFDRPDAVSSLSRQSERLRVCAGDVFVDPLPTADIYVLSEVICDWGDREATRILRAVRLAASPGVIVLIVENIVSDDEIDSRLLIVDLATMAITGGRRRTGKELTMLLRDAQFRVIAVLDTDGPMRIVEAIAV
jgi:C-methyltransferase